MGTLEKVSQMKGEGKSEEEIKKELQEQGISPREITEAMSQAKIKSAVSSSSNTDELQPSIMKGGEEPAPKPRNLYTPKTKEAKKQDLYVPSPQKEMPEYEEEPEEEYSPQDYQGEPQQQDYSQEYDDQGYYSQESTSSDLMIEIAEQVFAKKIREITKQIDNLEETKELMKSKVDDASRRLDRIETTIDKLQIAILEKISSYGKNIENVKKEMSMMQNSFGKVVNKAVATNAPKKVSSLPKKVAKKKSKK